FRPATIIKQSNMIPLNDQMAKTGTSKSDFVPSLLSAFSYNGKVFGIPKDFNTLGLVYNKDLFKAANVKEPTNDWTWDDLKTAAKALTKGDVVGLSLPADAARFMPVPSAPGRDVAATDNDPGQ